MQLYRLFETVHLLLERKTVTARELAERFGVSTRTIYRDIDTLSSAGIPVYAIQGKGGGISIMEEYVLDKALISRQEQQQILLSLQGLSAAGHPDLDATLTKLSSLFRQGNSSWIEVDFSRWGGHGEDRKRFHLLQAAVVNRLEIHFDYFDSAGGNSSRAAYPLKMVFKARNWYLQCFCLLRRDYRTFKIIRMQNVELTGESYDASRYLPALPAVEEAPGEPSHPSRPDTELLIRFAPEATYRLLDEFAPEQILREPEGTYLVSVTFPRDNWLMGFLLSFGGMAEVLEPEDIRRELLEQGEALRRIYGSPDSRR